VASPAMLAAVVRQLNGSDANKTCSKTSGAVRVEVMILLESVYGKIARDRVCDEFCGFVPDDLLDSVAQAFRPIVWARHGGQGPANAMANGRGSAA